MKTIYLDHAATTPIAPEVLQLLQGQLKDFVANSSSAHQSGSQALALLGQAREAIANKLGCEPNEISFTSGGTEGNNWILQRTMQDAAVTMLPRGMKPHLITSAIEHSSVANVGEWLKKTGAFEWSELPVDDRGLVNIPTLEALIQPNTVLVSIVHGNNEIGTIQDLKAIGDLCRAKKVLFHADACQTFCHEPFSIRELPVDFASLSGHKIRAPKGVGAVYVRKGIELTPLLFGGKQERGLRPGTTSVELICAFAKAAELWTPSVVDAVHSIRSYAIENLKAKVPGVRINGVEGSREDKSNGRKSLCHVLSFTVPDHHSKILQRTLSNRGIACSTGAACGTGKSESSAVLLGLGRDVKDAHQIRISFSPITDKLEVDQFMNVLLSVLKEGDSK